MQSEDVRCDLALLRQARLTVGWKQSRVIAALTAQASKQGIGIASPSSLKTMLSRWENGGGQPDKIYQQLFCEIYAREPDELGFTDIGPGEDSPVSRVAPSLDAETVDYFNKVLEQHIRADNLMGPHHLVEVVRAQAALIDDILPRSEGSVRNDLLMLACRYNEFTGWLYQDAGDPQSAMLYSDQAMDYALAIGDPAQNAYLLMRKSNIASDLGKVDRSLGLTDAALRHRSAVSPRIRALALGQQARAHALRGEASECARAIDAAAYELIRSTPTDEMITAYCTPAYLRMQAGICWTELNRPDQAISYFERALAAFPAAMRRDQGLCQTRLASAHAARGDKTNACIAGRQAVKTVRMATSMRSLQELRQLRQRLAPWRRDGEVSKLCQEIRHLATA